MNNSNEANSIWVKIGDKDQTLISIDDLDLIDTSWRLKDGYVRKNKTDANGRSSSLFLHQLILSRQIGQKLQYGQIADHENGNSLDNRRENLRIATYAESSRNTRMRSCNKVGFKGVLIDQRRQNTKWNAQAAIDGKGYHIGSFASPVATP